MNKTIDIDKAFNEINDFCDYAIKKCDEALKEIIENEIMKQEEHTMEVTYNGITGKLVKLERPFAALSNFADTTIYDLTIYNTEKKATVSFTGVKLADVKFSGGEVSFDG